MTASNTWTGANTFNADVTIGSGTAAKLIFGDGTVTTGFIINKMTTTLTPPTATWGFSGNSSGDLIIRFGTLGTSGIVKFNNNSGTTILGINVGASATQPVIKTYNNRSTAGMGIIPIFASDIETQTNTAPTGFSYSPPANAGTYRITGFIEVTTGTTISLKLKATYKTSGGNSGSDEMVFKLQNSTTLLTAIITTGRYNFEWIIGIDNSATAIALADNAGTYTTCVYNINAVLEQLA